MHEEGQSGEQQAAQPDASPDRWSLVRDIGILQVKLIVDGLRDFILVPVSLLAGLASLVKADTHANNDFYRLLRMGKRSERWINLFGAADRVETGNSGSAPGGLAGKAGGDRHERYPLEDIDALVNRLETFVVDEYHSGSVTGPARRRIERALEALQKLSSRKSGKGAGPG